MYDDRKMAHDDEVLAPSFAAFGNVRESGALIRKVNLNNDL
jgi:hypothetical protein